jgi:uncharacterized integral membrane protein
MLALLVAVLFGLAIGYFATQNTTPVTIRLAEYALEEIPLYFVVVGSLLIGLFIAWILYIAQFLSAKLTIYGRDQVVRKTRRTVADLEHRVRELEVENERLKAREPYPSDERDQVYHRHSSVTP